MAATPASASSFAEEEKGEFATAAVKEVDDLSDRERKDKERRLVRKLDLRIMPWLALAYLVTSLDVRGASHALAAPTLIRASFQARERRSARRDHSRAGPLLILDPQLGNAKVAGLTTDLKLGANDFNVATCLFVRQAFGGKTSS